MEWRADWCYGMKYGGISKAQSETLACFQTHLWWLNRITTTRAGPDKADKKDSRAVNSSGESRFLSGSRLILCTDIKKKARRPQEQQITINSERHHETNYHVICYCSWDLCQSAWYHGACSAKKSAVCSGICCQATRRYLSPFSLLSQKWDAVLSDETLLTISLLIHMAILRHFCLTLSGFNVSPESDLHSSSLPWPTPYRFTP